jgi:hypothetical protein
MAITLFDRRLGKIESGLRRVVLGAVIMSVFMLLSGCRKRPPEVVQQAPLGPFYVSRANSTIEADFHTGINDTTNCNLGFEVRGIELDSAFPAHFKYVLDALYSGKLRLRLQLFDKNTTNDFYCAEFQLGSMQENAQNGSERIGANYVYSGNLVKTYPLFYFAGLKPLGFYSYYEPKSSDLIMYHPQKDALTEEGKLLPDKDYKVKLTVLESINITNQFQLVLYQYLH